MEDLLIRLITLPDWVIHFFTVLLFLGIGKLLGYFFPKYFRKKAVYFFLFFGVAAGTLLPNAIQKHFAADVMVYELKKTNLYSILFDKHPEAESDLKYRYNIILKDVSNRQVVWTQVQYATSRVAEKYFNKYITSASDESIYKLVKHNANIYKALERKPKACVGQFLGKYSIKEGEISEALINSEINIRGDVIESAIVNPSTQFKKDSKEKVFEAIKRVYKNNKANESNFDLVVSLNGLSKLPPKKACEIILEYHNLMARTEPEQASYIFKNLVSLGL